MLNEQERQTDRRDGSESVQEPGGGGGPGDGGGASQQHSGRRSTGGEYWQCVSL